MSLFIIRSHCSRLNSAVVTQTVDYVRHHRRTLYITQSGCYITNIVCRHPRQRRLLLESTSPLNLFAFHSIWNQDCHNNGMVTTTREFFRPARMVVFPRSMSSVTDSDDSVEDVVKELEAEIVKSSKSKKGSLPSGVQTNSIRSVGGLLPDKTVNLLDEDGESLGPVNREDALRRSRRANLKLVLINPTSQPYPTYRLMTGQQLHKEQLLLRDKLKSRALPTQVKEVRITGNIAQHDLDVKRKQVHDWLKEGTSQVHVKVTVMGGGRSAKKITKEQQYAVIDQLMSGLEDRVTLYSKPRDVGKDGVHLAAVLRPMSTKEKAAVVRQKNRETTLTAGTAEDAPSNEDKTRT